MLISIIRNVSLLVLCLFIISCAVLETNEVMDYEKLKSVKDYEVLDADVYFVPIGPMSDDYLVSLASYYEDFFGLKVGITTPLPYYSWLYDPKRKQFKTNMLMTNIMSAFSGYSRNKKAIYIGVTHADMYSPSRNWKFAYADRRGWSLAVVSSSRTSRHSQPEFADIKEVHPGLRKMVTKTIGLLHYRKSMNSNPESVLYSKVMGLKDLERIDESTLYDDILGSVPMVANKLTGELPEPPRGFIGIHR
ncbi:MAG: putative Zn-dependent protease [Oleiphilaceae bacterium]|jgi:predicted Zn-dependent protease